MYVMCGLYITKRLLNLISFHKQIRESNTFNSILLFCIIWSVVHIPIVSGKAKEYLLYLAHLICTLYTLRVCFLQWYERNTSWIMIIVISFEWMRKKRRKRTSTYMLPVISTILISFLLFPILFHLLNEIYLNTLGYKLLGFIRFPTHPLSIEVYEEFV